MNRERSEQLVQLGTETLRQMAYDAEENGEEVEVYENEEHGIILFIEINGVEIENPVFADELEDARWMEDAYGMAEGGWRD